MRMSVITGTSAVTPRHEYPQGEITAAFARHVDPDGAHRATIERLHAATRVKTRCLALPLVDYPALDGFTGANEAFVREGVRLGAEAVLAALAGLLAMQGACSSTTGDAASASASTNAVATRILNDIQTIVSWSRSAQR